MSKQNNNNHEKIISPTRLIMMKFKSNRLAMLGFTVFMALIAIVVVGKIYYTAIGYNFADLTNMADKYQAPNAKYWFGTDMYGRDYFPRVITGGWIALQAAFVATGLSVGIGVIVGAISGYFGGWIDSLLMRIAEIVISLPFLPLAISISAIFVDVPETQRLFVMIGIIGLLGWPGLARMVRGQVMSLRKQEFMLANQALGISTFDQIMKHLIPNVVAYVIVSATISFAGAIMTEANLSFLGLSVREPVATWGGLLQRASNSVALRNYWWLWVYPGTLLFTVVMSINLIGEGLRDAVDPKSEYIEKKPLLRFLFGKFVGGGKREKNIRG